MTTWAHPDAGGSTALRAKRIGIETLQEYVVYMHRDCHVCRAEGLEAQARVLLGLGQRSIVATLNVVDPGLVELDEAGLSNSAWHALGARAADQITVSHAPTLDSMSQVRAKIYGHRLDAPALNAIVADVSGGRYPDTHIAAFLSACAGGRMDVQETIAFTRAMVAAGERIAWGHAPIADKHCVGGLPGNRTTPIVVAIVAAAGLTMPKTSSRAIGPVPDPGVQPRPRRMAGAADARRPVPRASRPRGAELLSMCFPATASFTAGVFLLGAGTMTLRMARQPSELLLAAIPLLFAIQPLTEGVIWLGFDWGAPFLTTAMTRLYSFFSHVARWFIAVWCFFAALLRVVVYLHLAARTNLMNEVHP